MGNNKRRDKQKEYKQANKLFLEAKAQEDGMTVLPSGIMYRRLKKGAGTVCPTSNSIVFVHYTGRLIDGSVFDSTETDNQLPACFVVNQLIVGWQSALSRMHEGDRIELYLPHEYGYGKHGTDGIPGYSTLIFEMELVKMERR